jgi:hypothetical protein
METGTIENTNKNLKRGLVILVLAWLASVAFLALVFGVIPEGACPAAVCPFG